MVRVAGVQIPENKKAKIALTYIKGIGQVNVFSVLREAGIDPEKKVGELGDKEINKLQKAIDVFPIEGALKKSVSDNIKRLKQIGSYRGARHTANLPVRGQRTRSNARTKRGKRQTIGAMRKKFLQKVEQSKKDKGRKEEGK